MSDAEVFGWSAVAAAAMVGVMWFFSRAPIPAAAPRARRRVPWMPAVAVAALVVACLGGYFGLKARSLAARVHSLDGEVDSLSGEVDRLERRIRALEYRR